MSPLLAAGLLGLALVDSTSIGTLFIPVWLLLTPGRVRVGRFAVYLGTIAAFYFVTGVVLALGAYVVFDELAALFSAENDNPVFRGGQMAAGVGLFLWGLWLGSKKRRAKREASKRGRLSTWRDRATTGGGNPAALAALALVAAGVEVLSMVPYLAAIGLMTAADLGVVGTGLTLALYCLVMVLPAAVLVAARIVAHDRVDPLLRRLNDWLDRHGSNALSWFVCIVGVHLALNGASVLFSV